MWTDDWFESLPALPRLFVLVDQNFELSLFDDFLTPIETNPAWDNISPRLIRLAQYIRWEGGHEWRRGVVFDTLRCGDVSVIVRLPVPRCAWGNLFDDAPQYQRRHDLSLGLQADQFQQVCRPLQCPTTPENALQKAQSYLFSEDIRRVNASAPWRFDQTQDEFILGDDL